LPTVPYKRRLFQYEYTFRREYTKITNEQRLHTVHEERSRTSTDTNTYSVLITCDTSTSTSAPSYGIPYGIVRAHRKAYKYEYYVIRVRVRVLRRISRRSHHITKITSIPYGDPYRTKSRRRGTARTGSVLSGRTCTAALYTKIDLVRYAVLVLHRIRRFISQIVVTRCKPSTTRYDTGTIHTKTWNRIVYDHTIIHPAHNAKPLPYVQ